MVITFTPTATGYIVLYDDVVAGTVTRSGAEWIAERTAKKPFPFRSTLAKLQSAMDILTLEGADIRHKNPD